LRDFGRRRGLTNRKRKGACRVARLFMPIHRLVSAAAIALELISSPRKSDRRSTGHVVAVHTGLILDQYKRRPVEILSSKRRTKIARHGSLCSNGRRIPMPTEPARDRSRVEVTQLGSSRRRLTPGGTRGALRDLLYAVMMQSDNAAAALTLASRRALAAGDLPPGHRFVPAV